MLSLKSFPRALPGPALTLVRKATRGLGVGGTHRGSPEPTSLPQRPRGGREGRGAQAAAAAALRGARPGVPAGPGGPRSSPAWPAGTGDWGHGSQLRP